MNINILKRAELSRMLSGLFILFLLFILSFFHAMDAHALETEVLDSGYQAETESEDIQEHYEHIPAYTMADYGHALARVAAFLRTLLVAEIVFPDIRLETEDMDFVLSWPVPIPFVLTSGWSHVAGAYAFMEPQLAFAPLDPRFLCGARGFLGIGGNLPAGIMAEAFGVLHIEGTGTGIGAGPFIIWDRLVTVSLVYRRSWIGAEHRDDISLDFQFVFPAMSLTGGV